MTATLTWNQAEKGLAEHWGSFKSRPQQRDFAHAVTETLHGNSKNLTRLAQAGVGCGKSLGYLIPAIASGRRVVVAVSTRALQDQLFNKDLPMLRDTLFPALKIAMLKGRSNYLCLRAADRSDQPFPAHVLPGSAGERSDLSGPVTDEQWRSVTVDAEGCVGRKACPFSDECYSEAAKRRAQTAQVLVVNISLLTQDLRLRAMTRGKVSLLGDYDVLIVDEAHEMADIVAGGLSTQLTLRRVMDTTSKLAYHLDGTDTPSQVEQVNSLASRYFNLAADWFRSQKDARTADLAAEDRAAIGAVLDALQPLVGKTSRAQCNCEPIIDPESGDEESVCEYARRVSSLATDLALFAASEGESTDVVWAETVGRVGQVALRSSPAEVGGWLRTVLWDGISQTDGEKQIPAVLTSATLGIGGDFTYVARRLGISAYDDIDVGTPFDYNRQAMLYLPPITAPNPGKQRNEWLIWSRDQTRELVTASRGDALLLFTSTTAMRDAYDVLSKRFRRLGMEVEIQGGGMDNRALAEWYAKTPGAVLFATRSFMTGVDFPGKKLVVIDKLPFPVPEDPVFKARCKAVEERFGERASFGRVSIPEMTTVLNQAVGRLIRNLEDQGVVAILDSRMRAGWAAKIRRALPRMPDASTIEQVQQFYSSLKV